MPDSSHLTSDVEFRAKYWIHDVSILHTECISISSNKLIRPSTSSPFLRIHPPQFYQHSTYT